MLLGRDRKSESDVLCLQCGPDVLSNRIQQICQSQAIADKVRDSVRLQECKFRDAVAMSICSQRSQK